MLSLIRSILKYSQLTPLSGPNTSIFHPTYWVTLVNSSMVECPLDVLRWAEKLYQVETRCILCYHPLPIGSMRRQMDSDIQIQVILGILIRSLGFHNVAAVVDGKGGWLSLSSCESMLASSLGNKPVIVPVPLPAHETVIVM